MQGLKALHFGDRSFGHLGGGAGVVLGVVIVAGLVALLHRAGAGTAAPEVRRRG